MRVQIKPSSAIVNGKYFLRHGHGRGKHGGYWVHESAWIFDSSKDFEFQSLEEAVNIRMNYVDNIYSVKISECFYVGNVCYISYGIRIESLWAEINEG